MQINHKLARLAAVAFACAIPLAAQAGAHDAKATGNDDANAHGAHHAAPAKAEQAAPAGDKVDGEVRRINKETQKITLRHGELPKLGMPPMTMVFRVTDPAFLDKVKVGDKVTFVAELVDGQFTVTQIDTSGH